MEEAPGERLGRCSYNSSLEMVTRDISLKRKEDKKESEFHYQLNAQASSLSRKIYKEHGVELQKLQILKNIYLLYFKKEKAVSKISNEQKELLEKIGVD